MSFLEDFSNIDGLEVEQSKDLSKLSTMRVKAQSNFITACSVDALCEVTRKATELGYEYILLGWGANQLLRNLSEKQFYLKLSLSFDKSYLDNTHDIYKLPASVSLSILSSHATKKGLTGWEVFTGIPASLGGAIFMNAGTNLGEIGDIVTCVRYVDSNGNKKEKKIIKGDFTYRSNTFLNKGDVIWEVEMKHLGEDPKISQKIKDYLALRNRSQPLKEATCGCVFKNNVEESCRAGQFIDIMGLKGLTFNGVRVSSKHANFMENYDGASYDDVMALIKMVQDELKLQCGVSFETEVKI